MPRNGFILGASLYTRDLPEKPGSGWGFLLGLVGVQWELEGRFSAASRAQFRLRSTRPAPGSWQAILGDGVLAHWELGGPRRQNQGLTRTRTPIPIAPLQNTEAEALHLDPGTQAIVGEVRVA
jgi:hypothetical protein